MRKTTPLHIEILDTTTGEIGTFHDTDTLDDDSRALYLWQDGNYSCDCNRGLFFARARHLPDGELDDVPCGTSRFLVRISREGDVLYDEFPKATGEMPAGTGIVLVNFNRDNPHDQSACDF